MTVKETVKEALTWFGAAGLTLLGIETIVKYLVLVFDVVSKAA